MIPAIINAAYIGVDFKKVSVKFEANCFKFEINDGAILLDVKCFTENKTKLDEVEYERRKFDGILLANPGHERGVVQVRCKGKSLGYIFNVNALTSETEYIEKWPRIFAHAASDILLHELAISDVVIGQNETDSEIEINDLFIGDDSSVIVLSKDQVAKVGIQLDEIRLFLNEFGYRCIDSEVAKLAKPTPIIPDPAIRLKHISTDVGVDAKRLCLIFDLTHHQFDSFSKYLTVYQVIEILINRLFPSLVNKISNDAELLANPRDMAQKISNSTKEDERIIRLYNDYLGRTAETAIFNTCKDLCNKFLDKYSPKYEIDQSGGFVLDVSGQKILQPQDWDWPRAIYKVRNLVVHSQINLIEKHHDDFIPVFHAFKLCCLQLIAYFNIPTGPTVTPSVSTVISSSVEHCIETNRTVGTSTLPPTLHEVGIDFLKCLRKLLTVFLPGR